MKTRGEPTLPLPSTLRWKRNPLDNFDPRPSTDSTMQTKTSDGWTVTTVFATVVLVTEVEVRALRTGLSDATISALFHATPRTQSSLKGCTNGKE